VHASGFDAGTNSSGAFHGATARSYAAYRRDVPTALIDALVSAVGLSARDVVVDLGCGTGQLALPLAVFAGTVVAVDPEPDMLVGLRARAQASGIGDIVCTLAGDRDLAVVGKCVGPLALIGVSNALHWMDAEKVFACSRELLVSEEHWS
jgi:SAM-dependent methyltransferase